MPVKFVYKDSLFGSGNLYQLPRTGDFFKVNGIVLKVEAVMFCIGESITNNVNAILYLTDVMTETERKLKYY